MRQAVPLLRSEAPIVGTGIERQLVRDSRTPVSYTHLVLAQMRIGAGDDKRFNVIGGECHS